MRYKEFYFYTNSSDFEVFLTYNSLIPTNFINSDIFGSFSTLYKNGLILTDKKFNESFIMDTCNHINIFPVIMNVALYIDDNVKIIIVNSNYECRYGYISDYTEKDLVIVVPTYIPMINVTEITSLGSKIRHNVFDNLLCPETLLKDELFKPGKFFLDYCKLQETIDAFLKNEKIYKDLYIYDKLKAAYLCAYRSFYIENSDYSINFDEALYNNVKSDKDISYSNLLIEKYNKKIKLDKYLGKGMKDILIFKNIDKIIKAYLDKNIDDFIKSLNCIGEYKYNLYLFYAAIRASLKTQKAKPDDNDKDAWLNDIIEVFTPKIDKVAANESVKSFYESLSLYFKHNISEILEKTKNNPSYFAFRVIFMLYKNLTVKFKILLQNCEYYKIGIFEKRLILFLFGLVNGVSHISREYKDNDYVMRYIEIKLRDLIEDKHWNVVSELLPMEKYIKFRRLDKTYLNNNGYEIIIDLNHEYERIVEDYILEINYKEFSKLAKSINRKFTKRDFKNLIKITYKDEKQIKEFAKAIIEKQKKISSKKSKTVKKDAKSQLQLDLNIEEVDDFE